jgi:hypothetical protein
MNPAHLHLLTLGAMVLIIGVVVEIDGRLRRRKRRRQTLDASKTSH